VLYFHPQSPREDIALFEIRDYSYSKKAEEYRTKAKGSSRKHEGTKARKKKGVVSKFRLS
jgi:hypothetical protein